MNDNQSEAIERQLLTLNKYPVLKAFLSLDDVRLEKMSKPSLKHSDEHPMLVWIRKDSPVLECLEDNLQILLPVATEVSERWKKDLVNANHLLEVFAEIELAGLLKRSGQRDLKPEFPIQENGKDLDLMVVLDQRNVFFEVKKLNLSPGRQKRHDFFRKLENHIRKYLEEKVGYGQFSIAGSISDYYFDRNIINPGKHLSAIWKGIKSNLSSLVDYSKPVILIYHFDQNLDNFVSGEGYHDVKITIRLDSSLEKHGQVTVPYHGAWSLTVGDDEIKSILKKVRSKFQGLDDDQINRYQPLIAYVDIDRLDRDIYPTNSIQEEKYKATIKQVLTQASSRISALILVHGISIESGRLHFKRLLCKNPNAEVHLTEIEKVKLERVLMQV